MVGFSQFPLSPPRNKACNAVAGIKGIQTLDLSSNRLSKEGAKQLAKALWRCRSLHEIVLEESVEEKDSEEVCCGVQCEGGKWGGTVGYSEFA